MCEQSVRVENDKKINNRSVANKENQGGKKCQKKNNRAWTIIWEKRVTETFIIPPVSQILATKGLRFGLVLTQLKH